MYQFESSHIEKLKTIAGRQWLPEQLMWTIPYTINSVEWLIRLFKHEDIRVDIELMSECELLQPYSLIAGQVAARNESDREQLDRLQAALRLKGFSQQTIHAYKGQVERFLKHVRAEAGEIEENSLKHYSLKLLDRSLSSAYVNQAISAIRFYLIHIHGQAETVSYIRPKKEKKLPHVCTQNEVLRILKATTNLKHQAILSLTYSSGLRVSEVVKLKRSDLDSERNTLLVRQGKGRKDRYTLLSEAAMKVVQSYIEQQKNTSAAAWLFPGQYSGSHITIRTVQKIFEQCAANAGIQKKLSIHSLRHSFATHLLEGGTDIRYIQELLGHQSSRTTEIYTHVTLKDVRRIRSPLDRINDEVE